MLIKTKRDLFMNKLIEQKEFLRAKNKNKNKNI